MIMSFKLRFQALGFLRQGLLILAALSIAIPTIAWTLQYLGQNIAEDSLLDISAGLIAPVMAPLLVVVIFFDVLMSKIRAADDPGEEGDVFRKIAQTETMAIAIMFLFWVPFFVTL